MGDCLSVCLSVCRRQSADVIIMNYDDYNYSNDDGD